MSWNPSPSLGGANWAGNAQLATKQQLLSTSSGLYEDLKDFNFSTISVSTLTVPLWISTSALYVSDIQGYRIDLSGVTIDSSGVFVTNVISSGIGNFTEAVVSTLSLAIKPPNVNISLSFNLGLGEALGGFLAGLGAAVGGAFIGVGTALGLAIQGAEQGIATIIAGRPQNFITNNTYETINFTSQLQVSTLGNAYPAYSSIFRTVSTNFTDQEPGREIFTSTIFYPGQICIRAASDPFNLITTNPDINTSTIQSFGQWVPLEGLEPTNVIADSVSTNKLSTGQMFVDLGTFTALDGYSIATSNLGVAQGASLAYNAGLQFDLGSSGDAAIVGSINQWNFLTNQPITFFGQLGEPGALIPGATLTLGNGAESILEVSSILMTGDLQANTGYFSSLTVNELTVVSSFSTIYTIVACNVFSTSLISAYLVSTINLEAQYVSPFTISSSVGNPYGPFDFTKYEFIQSTTFNQVSSLTQNILSYTLVEEIQDQTSFNLNIAETPFGVNYMLTPQNVSQWGSSIMIFNDYQNPGSVTLPVASAFTNCNLTGVFDIQTQYNPQTPGYYAGFTVVQTWIPGSEFSTFSTFLQLSGPNPPVSPPLDTWRFEIGTNGWIQSVTPNATPFETTNSNVFTITQDINDTTIAASDRLNLEAGEIVMKGTLNLTNTNVQTAYAINSYTSNATVSTIQGNTAFFSTVTVDPYNGGFESYHLKSTISYNNAPTSVTPLSLTFQVDSPDFIPTYNIIAPFIGNNYFTSYNYTSWNNTMWNNNVASVLGTPNIYCGDLQNPLGTYSAFFYINNTITAPAYSLPVYYINSSGSNLLGNVAGNTYAKIETTNGTTWTLTPNIANPIATGGSFDNSMTVTQVVTGTQITNTQNLTLQSPNTNIITGTMGLFADQIRVNSHKYGTLESTGLNSYPIGIENTLYVDANISWSNTPGADASYWQSDATNILYNVTNSIYYDANSWIVQIIPSRFRTNNSLVVSWDVQPAIFAVSGGTGYCWGFNRYIQVNTTISGPGNNANNWNWIIAFPKNYCTY